MIIDEYKKLKVDAYSDSLKVNRKNKPILVKGDKFFPCLIVFLNLVKNKI